MYCPNCGKVISAENAFCQYCGANVGYEEKANKWIGDSYPQQSGRKQAKKEKKRINSIGRLVYTLIKISIAAIIGISLLVVLIEIRPVELASTLAEIGEIDQGLDEQIDDMEEEVADYARRGEGEGIYSFNNSIAMILAGKYSEIAQFEREMQFTGRLVIALFAIFATLWIGAIVFSLISVIRNCIRVWDYVKRVRSVKKASYRKGERENEN